MTELTRQLEIVNPLGLHARAAARLAALAGEASGAVWVANGVERADATSIIDLLALACGQGSQITVEIEDPADGETLERLVALIREGFGE